MSTPKQTAANNPFLDRVKAAMNEPIYREVSLIENRDGHDAARSYLARFFREGTADQQMTFFETGETR